MSDDARKARTDAKLRYARVHLDELGTQPPGRGHDYERAHQEAFLAQLFGAYAAMLQELNVALGCNLRADEVTLGKMYRALGDQGRSSPLLADLYRLESDRSSWFHCAKEMRDHTTHVSGIPLVFYFGGPTSLRHPKTMTELPGDARVVFASWLSEMEGLAQRMRS
jgi:hypothetical protein